MNEHWHVSMDGKDMIGPYAGASTEGCHPHALTGHDCAFCGAAMTPGVEQTCREQSGGIDGVWMCSESLAETHPCTEPGCDTGSTVDHQEHMTIAAPDIADIMAASYITGQSPHWFGYHADCKPEDCNRAEDARTWRAWGRSSMTRREQTVRWLVDTGIPQAQAEAMTDAWMAEDERVMAAFRAEYPAWGEAMDVVYGPQSTEENDNR